MGNCEKLKWNRRRMGLSQKAFADKVGVSVGTIYRLERDETAWLTIQNTTEDKICAVFESMASWQPERADKILREINDSNFESYGDEVEEIKEEKPMHVKVEKEPIENKNSLNAHDQKTLTLIEFAYEGLAEAKTHEEFEANINMLRRVLNKY